MQTENAPISSGPETTPIPPHVLAPKVETKKEESQVEEAPAVVTEEPFYKGSKEVKSPEELKEYAKDLESQVALLRTMAQPLPPVVTPAPREDQFEDLIYTDAAKAKQVLKNEILGEMQRQGEVKQNQEKFWKDFYSANSDLKTHERLVQLVLKDKLPDLQALPADKGKEELAKEVRSLLSSVRQSTSGTESEISSGAAVTLPTSGTPAGSSKVTAPKGPTNFADQLQALKNKKGRLN